MNRDSTKQNGLLDLVANGDTMAALTALQLVEKNKLMPGQLASMLIAAATGRMKLLGAGKDYSALDNLARLSAWKMQAPMLRFVKAGIIAALKDPDKTELKRLKQLSRTAVFLMDEQLLKNGDLIDIAEAVADGLARTRNRTKIAVMQNKVAACLDMRLSNDLGRVYDAVFELALRPRVTRDCEYITRLTAYTNRAKNGTVKLDPAVISRMRVTLDSKNEQPKKEPEPAKEPEPVQIKPLSDGDMALSKPMIAKEAAKRRTVITLVNAIKDAPKRLFVRTGFMQ